MKNVHFSVTFVKYDPLYQGVRSNSCSSTVFTALVFDIILCVPAHNIVVYTCKFYACSCVHSPLYFNKQGIYKQNRSVHCCVNMLTKCY